MKRNTVFRWHDIPLCTGFLFALLVLPGSGFAQPWRDLEPFPASSIVWQQGLIGTINEDQTRLYHLTAQGGLGIPFLASGPTKRASAAGLRISRSGWGVTRTRSLYPWRPIPSSPTR